MTQLLYSLVKHDVSGLPVAGPVEKRNGGWQ